MNKAKAYKRLKKTQKQSIHEWAEPCTVNDKLRRLPLKELNQTNGPQVQQQTLSDSTTDISMFGVRTFNTLKTFTEAETSDTAAKTESKRNISLPNISNKQWVYQRGGGPHNGGAFTLAQDQATPVKRPETTGPTSYTLLQAKLDALILPNPIKRKASRSFSGSSSGFIGRKFAVARKDKSAMKSRSTMVNDEEATVQNSPSVQFPVASKMRQLLAVEPIIETPTHNATQPISVPAPKKGNVTIE